VDQSEEYVKNSQSLLAAVFLAAARRSLGKKCTFVWSKVQCVSGSNNLCKQSIKMVLVDEAVGLGILNPLM